MTIISALAVYLFLTRDTFERDHRERILALKAEAKALQALGELQSATDRYAELIALVGGRSVRDAELSAAVSEARASRTALNGQIERKAAAEEERQEAERQKQLVLKREEAEELKRQEQLNAANLPYVGDGFRVMVMEEKDFAKERDELTMLRPNSIDVTGEPATAQDVQDWAANNDPLISTLDGKVARLPTITTHARRIAFRDEMIQHFLYGQNVVRALQKAYPISYDRVVRVKYGKERYLRTTSMIATGNPATILTDTIGKLREAIENEKCGVTSGTADALTYEAVADWLLRCPLDFPEVAAS